MKAKLLAVFCLATLVAVATVRAETDDPPQGHNPLRKLGRGVSNLLFGVVEIPNQYTKAVSLHGGASGVTYGLPKGLTRWIGRELTGVYEIITFPIPFPKGYQPVMKPEFPNEDYEP